MYQYLKIWLALQCCLELEGVQADWALKEAFSLDAEKCAIPFVSTDANEIPLFDCFLMAF